MQNILYNLLLAIISITDRGIDKYNIFISPWNIAFRIMSFVAYKSLSEINKIT